MELEALQTAHRELVVRAGSDDGQRTLRVVRAEEQIRAVEPVIEDRSDAKIRWQCSHHVSAIATDLAWPLEPDLPALRIERDDAVDQQMKMLRVPRKRSETDATVALLQHDVAKRSRHDVLVVVRDGIIHPLDCRARVVRIGREKVQPKSASRASPQGELLAEHRAVVVLAGNRVSDDQRHLAWSARSTRLTASAPAPADTGPRPARPASAGARSSASPPPARPR